MGLSKRALPSAINVPSSAEEPATPQAPPRRWTNDETAWDTVRRIALDRLDQMMSLEPKVLRGDKPGAIHDFRVASRRFQQAFDLLCPEEPPKNFLRLRRSIARSRRAFSDVRNFDVFIRRVDKILARKRVPRRQAWEAVRGYLGRQREKRFAGAVEEIGELNLTRAYVRLRSALEPDSFFAGRMPDAVPQKVSAGLGEDQFEERLSRELARAWESFDQSSARAIESSAAEAIHSTRLAVKRLRYLMEIIREFERNQSAHVISLARELQDCLGAWHDLEVEDAILAAMVARPKYLRKHMELAAEILKLMTQTRREKKRLAGKLQAALNPATREQIQASVRPLM